MKVLLSYTTNAAMLVRMIRKEVKEGKIHPQELLAQEQKLVRLFGEKGFESLVDEAAVTSGAHVGF